MQLLSLFTCFNKLVQESQTVYSLTTQVMLMVAQLSHSTIWCTITLNYSIYMVHSCTISDNNNMTGITLIETVQNSVVTM